LQITRCEEGTSYQNLIERAQTFAALSADLRSHVGKIEEISERGRERGKIEETSFPQNEGARTGIRSIDEDATDKRARATIFGEDVTSEDHSLSP
jgi:hypothetical protein